MALDSATVALDKTVTEAGVAIDCALKTYDPSWIKVYYGDDKLQAVYETDYTVAVATDYNSFQIIPTASLVAKLDALGDGNDIVVARMLPTTSDLTESDAFDRGNLVKEFDKVAMIASQLTYLFGFIPETLVTDIQSAVNAVDEAREARDDAQTAQAAAETAQSAAETAQSAAETAQSAAAASAGTASTKAGEAAASATTAGTKAGEAAASATTANTKAGEASASAAAAATAETNAETAETNAGGILAEVVASGKAMRFGSGAPDNSVGYDGEVYLDYANWNIYGPKAAGAWPGAVSVIGPPGAGSGDVVGPGSATVDRVATFADANGKEIQDSGVLLSELATLADPAFTGNPTAPTQTLGNNSTRLATTAFVAAAIAALADSAPSTLDTLNELAAALGDDPNFATTITNLIAAKAPLDDAALTGEPTTPTPTSGDDSTRIASTAFVQDELTDGLAAKAALAQTDSISALIETPGNKDYKIWPNMPYGITVQSITTVCVSGSCTVTGKINTTALGGSANSASSTESTQNHASANVAAAGDDLVLNVSGNASSSMLSVTVTFTRNLEA